MSEASPLQYCTKCGAVLRGHAANRLCAACLLESAIEDPADGHVETSKPTSLLAFNDYELLEEIARGGMGVVYRARQTSLNRPIAIKMMLGGHLANTAELKRFRAEAETAAQLRHPNIVAIHEVAEHAGQPFFSMELVQGQNLAQLVRDEALPSRKAAAYLKTIAEAIQYAHSRGVLHRDLKPSNILIDENDQPRITDFGLAKRFSTSAGTLSAASQSESANVGDTVERVPIHELTQTGQVLGSPSFIPPEQAAGQKGATCSASDVYSLGAILYHCLTARPPFMAESLTQTLRLVAEQEPVSPRLLNAGVPRDLETICLKCLEKDPGRRYPSAQELADDLNRFLHNEPIHARPIGSLLKVHRWCLRNKALAVSGTAILALLLVVAIGSPIAAIRIDRERKQAQANEQRAQAVSDFLIQAFRSPDPARDGRTITIVEVLNRDVQELQKKFKDDPGIKATLLINIAWAYSTLSLLDESVPLFEQALELRKRHLGEQNDETVQVKQCLALHYWLTRQFEKALPLAEDVYRTRLEKFGSNYVSTLTAEFELGKYYRAAGREPEGQSIMEHAYKALHDTLGPEDPEVFWHTTAMADMYRGLGRAAQALALDEPLLSYRRGKMGPNHPDTIHSMRSLAEDYIAVGRSQEAVALLKETIELSATRLGPDHSATVRAKRLLTELLDSQSQPKH